MKLGNIFAIFTALALVFLPSCLGDSDTPGYDYSEWYMLNQQYVDSIEQVTENGALVYKKIVPVWDKSIFVLMKWINNPEENTNELTPLSTSTITVKYTLTTVEGDTLDANSSYQLQPCNMVTGFWAAVTNMHVNDTVNVVIPYAAGYGDSGYGSVPPYSTLIFGIRLDSIDKLFD